ncbi:hypothetical protein TNCV_4220021 [Trichonephila clavipes]|nr:hypothetical protein TNCV_4220021 [Trichonephila clavipes]
MSLDSPTCHWTRPACHWTRPACHWTPVLKLFLGDLCFFGPVQHFILPVQHVIGPVQHSMSLDPQCHWKNYFWETSVSLDLSSISFVDDPCLNRRSGVE